MTYDIFQLVLDFREDPSHFAALIGPDKPLPEDLGKLLETVAAEDAADPESRLSEELVAAASFFVGRVLFVPGGDYYRHLGVDRHATQEQIRRHYHLLMHLFMLDRDDMAEGWSAEFAECINRAYSILRDPAKRREYDLRQAGPSPGGGEINRQKEDTHSFARSIVSFAKVKKKNEPEQTGTRPEGVAGSGASLPGGLAGTAVRENGVASAVASAQDEESFIADSIERAYNDAGVRAAPPVTPVMPDVEEEGRRSSKIAPIVADEDLGSAVEAAYQRRSRGRSSARWGVILATLLVFVGVLAAVYEYQIAPGQLSALFSEDGTVDPGAARAPSAAAPEMPVLAGNAVGPAAISPEAPEKEPLGVPKEEAAVPASPEMEEEPRDSRPVAQSEGEREPLQSVVEEKKEAPVVEKITTEKAPADERREEPVVTGLTLSPRRTSQTPPVPAPVNVPAPMQKRVEALISKPAKKQVEKPAAVSMKAAEPAVPLAPGPVPTAVPVQPGMQGKIQQLPAGESAAPTFDVPSRGESVTGIASLPPPPPLMETPRIEAIPQEELDSMMRVFVRSYEEGDLRGLLSVFAQDARTNDRNDREGIAGDYRELFEVTEKRQFIIEDLTWTQSGKDRAQGEGGFEVKVLLKGEPSITTVKGRVKIDVEKRGRDVLITRFFHTYE